MFDYFYGLQAEQFSFYRVPKVLFTVPFFRRVSTEAKTLYGILLDRMNLSAKNGWIDKEGRVYIVFTIEEIMNALGCARQKAVKLLDELETNVGLIERKRRGLGRPNLIYVKNFIADVTKPNLQKYENHTPGCMKDTFQEVPKSNGNNTEMSNTEMKDTDPSDTNLIPSDVTDNEMRARRSYETHFRNALEIDLVKHVYPRYKETIDAILSLLVDACSSDRAWFMIGGNKKSAREVKSQFMKLTYDHLLYVLECLSEKESGIQDMTQFLMTALYNAPEMQAQENCDMACLRL